MPELPEVETIARFLQAGNNNIPGVAGKVIINTRVFWNGSLENISEPDFIQHIKFQRIEKVFRKGKFLVFPLTDYYMLIHLRMSGDISIKLSSEEILKHDRVKIDFDNSWSLTFNDPRKFGRVWLVRDVNCVTGNLGPDPLDKAFNFENFYSRLIHYRRQIKPLLMDQSFLAGLGNIYTDEALFRARIHPLVHSNTIHRNEGEILYKSIRSVLDDGIKNNGASIDWVYRGGEFQNYFNVYGRKGDPCKDCGTPIERIIVGQRGTHFCPSCQKLPGLRP